MRRVPEMELEIWLGEGVSKQNNLKLELKSLFLLVSRISRYELKSWNIHQKSWNWFCHVIVRQNKIIVGGSSFEGPISENLVK